MKIRPSFAALALFATAAMAQTADPAAPKGKLPDAATPTAYRLQLTVLPDQPRFSGHTEIDAVIKAPTAHLYMHGRDLAVSKAVAMVGGKPVTATWTQVDKTGVVRLDFPATLPAGPVTLAFDYDAAFHNDPSGMYHIKVGGVWYAWTQFESTDARAAYPSFDEPGYKTPFTIAITTAPGLKTVSNAPEVSVTKTGAMETHHFAPTKPLPTYLVAMDTGPFLHPTTTIAPDPQRSAPLPLGAVAAQAQAGKLDYVLAETPRIVTLLEKYFGQAFPFPKLDQIGTPEMPGAMENAGADTYADDIIELDSGATIRQRQQFGMIVAHELAHQWFGDLVSPAWWDDIWLNESFANWMGYRIGDEWRPELHIADGALAEGFAAMGTDALEVGRPIHQHIATNAEIDSAFDTITYGKGGQVIAMIAAYMGDDTFKAGVRLHLQRHAYGNADTDQFFQALADAGRDPRILAAMRSFVEQPGVPLVTFTRTPQGLVATQSRYAFLGSTPPAQSWTIPLCLGGNGARACTLLNKPSMTITNAPAGPLVPNAGGTGYYRFDMPEADWQATIAALPTMRSGEALAVNDSLWASFSAGRASAQSLLAETRAIARNPSSSVSLLGGERLAALRSRGLIDGAAVADYQRLMRTLYVPMLAQLGFDPAAGVYAKEDPDRQKLRQSLVGLVADDAEDPATNAKLAAAAQAYLGGNKAALDQSFLGVGFLADVKAGGVPAAQAIADKALGSEDTIFRNAALRSISRSGRRDVADWIIGFTDPRLRPTERLALIGGLAATAATREIGSDWILANYARIAVGNGIFLGSRLPAMLSGACSVERAAQIETQLGPKVRANGLGVLSFERTLESIRHCAVLKAARQSEITKALAAG